MTAQVLREARCRVVGRYLELIQEELALMYAEFQADAEKIKALAARMASTPGKPGKPQPAARSATDQQEQKNKGKQ